MWKASLLDQVPWGQKWSEWLSPQHPPAVLLHTSKRDCRLPQQLETHGHFPGAACHPGELGSSFVLIKK